MTVPHSIAMHVPAHLLPINKSTPIRTIYQLPNASYKTKLNCHQLAVHWHRSSQSQTNRRTNASIQRKSNVNQASTHRNTMPIWWCQYYKSRKCIQFDYNPMSIQQKSVANQVSIQFNLMPIWCQSNDNPCQCQYNTKISGQSANFRTI